MFQDPQRPAADDDAGDEPDEALNSVAKLIARAFFLRDAEDDGGKQGEHYGGGKVGEFVGHDFFPMAIWCASTAQMMFSRPATMMNLVP